MAREVGVPKVGYKEVSIAILFLILVIATIGLIAANVIQYPVTLGLTLLMTVFLVFIGFELVNRGKMPASLLPFYFIMVFSLIMIFYGLAYKGYIPVLALGATIFEIALSTAVVYAFIAVGVGVILYIFLFRKK